jgi:hypothetical protein
MVYQASGQTINTVGAAVSRAGADTCMMMYLYTYCGYVFRMRKGKERRCQDHKIIPLITQCSL